MPVPQSALANAFNLLRSLGTPQVQADVLNRVTSPISPETQNQILNAPTFGQRALGTVSGMRQMMVPQQGQQRTPAPIPKEAPKEDSPEKQSADLSWLKYAIPAITAGIGTAFPGTLPMAAGFQEGFVGETTKLDQESRENATAENIRTEDKEKSIQSEATKRADAIFGSSDFQKPPSAIEYQFMIDALVKQLKGDDLNTEYPLGETIEEGGKKYRIIGYHPDGEPALKEVN